MKIYGNLCFVAASLHRASGLVKFYVKKVANSFVEAAGQRRSTKQQYVEGLRVVAPL